MAWVKLDDSFPEHHKVIAAGGDAAWLHVCALAYANRNLTDGHIPAGVVTRLSDRRQPMKLAARLVEAGLWDVVDGGWVIHDYLLYQPARDKVQEERRKAQERMQAVRGSRNVRANNERTSEDVRDMFAGSSPNPDPTRPDPTRVSTSVDRQTLPTGEQVGQSVEDGDPDLVTEAVRLYAAAIYERNPGKCTGNRARYEQGIARNALDELGADLDLHVEEHPDATVHDLCTHVLGLNDIDLYNAGYYRKGA